MLRQPRLRTLGGRNSQRMALIRPVLRREEKRSRSLPGAPLRTLKQQRAAPAISTHGRRSLPPRGTLPGGTAPPIRRSLSRPQSLGTSEASSRGWRMVVNRILFCFGAGSCFLVFLCRWCFRWWRLCPWSFSPLSPLLFPFPLCSSFLSSSLLALCFYFLFLLCSRLFLFLFLSLFPLPLLF